MWQINNLDYWNKDVFHGYLWCCFSRCWVECLSSCPLTGWGGYELGTDVNRWWIPCKISAVLLSAFFAFKLSKKYVPRKVKYRLFSFYPKTKHLPGVCNKVTGFCLWICVWPAVTLCPFVRLPLTHWSGEAKVSVTIEIIFTLQRKERTCRMRTKVCFETK